MAIEVPDIPVTGTVIESAWGADVANSIAELDPSGASPGDVLKVNSDSDGYDFGRAGMKRSAQNGTFMIPAGPDNLPAVASSASSDTYGAWVELEDAAAADLLILGVSVSPNDSLFSASGDGYLQVDIGVGAAASEVSIGEARFDWSYNSTVDRGVGATFMPLITPLLVAQGARIAVRTADEDGQARNNRVGLIAINTADLEDF